MPTQGKLAQMQVDTSPVVTGSPPGGAKYGINFSGLCSIPEERNNLITAR
jgi:hypothetical protein